MWTPDLNIIYKTEKEIRQNTRTKPEFYIKIDIRKL